MKQNNNKQVSDRRPQKKQIETKSGENDHAP